MAQPGRNNQDQLLAQARGGNVEAFAQIFEDYRPLMHSVAYRLVGPNDCDDVVMDTYLKAWRSLSSFRGSSKISTWLCRITHNCALDCWRKRARQNARQISREDPEEVPLIDRLPDESLPPPDKAAQDHDLGRAINAAMEQLSEAHRTVILLREVDGLGYREIASSVGVSIGTVMSRLFHARRRLRHILEASGQWAD